MRAFVLLLGAVAILTACNTTAAHCDAACDAGAVCVICDGGTDCRGGEVCADRCQVFGDGGSDCGAATRCQQVPPAEPYHCCSGCPCAAPHDEQVCR